MSACKTPSGVPGSEETRDVLEAYGAKMLHVAMHPDGAEEGDGSSCQRAINTPEPEPRRRAVNPCGSVVGDSVRQVECPLVPPLRPTAPVARSLSLRRSIRVRPLTRSVNASPADLESDARSSFLAPGPANGVRQEEDFATVHGYPPQDRRSHG